MISFHILDRCSGRTPSHNSFFFHNDCRNSLPVNRTGELQPIGSCELAAVFRTSRFAHVSGFGNDGSQMEKLSSLMFHAIPRILLMSLRLVRSFSAKKLFK